MDKYELAVILTKMRIAHFAESQGHSPEDARSMAHDAIRQGGISGIMAMATPEGAIVTIVESYLQFIAKRCLELGSADHFEQANDEAITKIEAIRSLTGAKGLASYPKDIDDYVYYRVNLEIQHEFGCSADSRGLDRQTAKMLTHTAKHNLMKTMTEEPQRPSGPKSCFVATACFGSSDAATVIMLRRYRDTILKKHTVGRGAVYWYYKLSPPIANYVANHDRVKRIVRSVLAGIAKQLATKYDL